MSGWGGTGIALSIVVLVQPDFPHQDDGSKFVTELDQQVDVVEVLLATAAVSQIIARVDGGSHFTTTGAQESEVAFAPF